MSFVTEILEEKPSVLIVSEKNQRIIQLLKLHLKKNQADVYYSPVLPKNLTKFEYIFFLNEENIPKKALISNRKKVTLIYLNNQSLAMAQKQSENSHFKIVDVLGDSINLEHVDKLLWFAFSQTKENYLQITTTKNGQKIKKQLSLPKFQVPPGKKLFLYFLLFFLFLHLVFFPPLFGAAYFFYRSAVLLKQGAVTKAESNYEAGKVFLTISKNIYKIPRTTFLIFSLTFPDFIFKNTERASITLEKSLNLQQNTKELIKLILNKEKTTEENKLLSLRLETVKNDINIIEENISNISREIPASLPGAKNIKQELLTYLDLVSRLNQLTPHLDSLLAKNTEKTYLLLFANNMEIRPGGGFIGSFGLLKIRNYTVEEIKIYDVYDADGQLVAHVEPPDPLRKYLNQPNWFLRDSAFSPDLLQNYSQAKYFLDREMGFNNFSGSLLLTTTTVQNLLGAFPEIYLPDFDEKINQKNFYLKTQYHSEKNFFPGSIQKKNFLGSLTQTILLNLENASPHELAKALKKSLDEKQLVMYFDDPKLQKTIDSFYWSGRTIPNLCLNAAHNCLSDYIFPIDANLGLNKVNFFVSRHAELKVNFDAQGKVNNTFSLQFKNDSSDAFPGGTYRNYFQIYLPTNSVVKSVTKDGVAVEDYDEETDLYKKIGFLVEVKTKSITDIKISYQLKEGLKKGRNIYQLIAQKQIGASNSDLTLELIIGKNLNLINQNFPALVKDSRIIYNTSLSTDKIFFVELIKE